MRTQFSGRLHLVSIGCMIRLMSWLPVRKLVGIGNVFVGTDVVDIAEYDLELFKENPESHEHHGANWSPGAVKVIGTVSGGLPIRKEMRLVTEEEYSLVFYLKDSFGTVVTVGDLLDGAGKPVH